MFKIHKSAIIEPSRRSKSSQVQSNQVNYQQYDTWS